MSTSYDLKRGQWDGHPPECCQPTVSLVTRKIVRAGCEGRGFCTSQCEVQKEEAKIHSSSFLKVRLWSVPRNHPR
eukprot:478171-Amphidinium_carterae.7